MKSEQRRGRRHLDLAHLVRNRGWYRLVKAIAGVSDVKIDADVLKIRVPRAREGISVFDQMFRAARSPDERKRTGGWTVYALVHRDAQFEAAQKWFESKLWYVLSEPTISPDDYEQLIEEEYCRHGWVLPKPPFTWEMFSDLYPVAGADPTYSAAGRVQWVPAGNPNPPLPLPAGLTGLDRITLLCALSRSGVRLSRLGGELQTEVLGLLADPPFGADQNLDALFRLLVEERVAHGCWDSTQSLPQSSSFSAAAQKYLDRYLWHVRFDRRSEQLRADLTRLHKDNDEERLRRRKLVTSRK